MNSPDPLLRIRNAAADAGELLRVFGSEGPERKELRRLWAEYSGNLDTLRRYRREVYVEMAHACPTEWRGNPRGERDRLEATWLSDPSYDVIPQQLRRQATQALDNLDATLAKIIKACEADGARNFTARELASFAAGNWKGGGKVEPPPLVGPCLLLKKTVDPQGAAIAGGSGGRGKQ